MRVITVRRLVMCLMAPVFALALVGAVSFVDAQASTTDSATTAHDIHLYSN
jgi:hypothetical protein